MRAFGFIFQQCASFGIEADFLSYFADQNVEGVAQATATRFFFQLLVGNFARMCLECNRARFDNRDAGFAGQIVTCLGTSVQSDACKQ